MPLHLFTYPYQNIARAVYPVSEFQTTRMKLKKDHEQTLTWVIAIHTAWYCAEDFVQQYKRCGNSWGCPAVSKPDFMKLKPYFAKGILLYIYGS